MSCAYRLEALSRIITPLNNISSLFLNIKSGFSYTEPQYRSGYDFLSHMDKLSSFCLCEEWDTKHSGLNTETIAYLLQRLPKQLSSLNLKLSFVAYRDSTTDLLRLVFQNIQEFPNLKQLRIQIHWEARLAFKERQEAKESELAKKQTLEKIMDAVQAKEDQPQALLKTIQAFKRHGVMKQYRKEIIAELLSLSILGV